MTKKYLNQTPNARSLEDVDDEKFRFKEYIAFASNVRPALEDRNDFDIYPCDMSKYQPWITEYFIKIIRVERLKETRAFTGFSRIIPTNPGEETILINREEKFWLPAVEVRGEGIAGILRGILRGNLAGKSCEKSCETILRKNPAKTILRKKVVQPSVSESEPERSHVLKKHSV